MTFLIWPILVVILGLLALYLKNDKFGSAMVLFIVIGSIAWGLYLGYLMMTSPAAQNSLCPQGEQQVQGYCQGSF